MAGFVDSCRAAGVTDMRFSFSGGFIWCAEDYPDDQRAIIDSVLASYSQGDGPALDEAVASRTLEAAAAADAVLAPLAARFPAWETKTWDKQLAEAKALLADPTLADSPDPNSEDPQKRVDRIPTIRGITAVTGESVGEFAMAVQANDEAWTAIVSNVAGQRQKFAMALEAAASAPGATVANVLAVPLAIALPG